MTKTEHPYAQVLRWIADGETVQAHHEVTGFVCVGGILDIVSTPTIANGYTFSIKPRTININGHEVPEPMRVAPAFGTKYYVPYLQVACENPFDELTWYAEGGDRFRLSLGICHATREAAEAHARALLSFTTVEAA